MEQDPYHLDNYLAANPFLPDINNERPAKNALYKDNFSSLERLVLFRFSKDVTVVPMDSAWFSWYNGTRLLSMQETDLYQVHSRQHPCLANMKRTYGQQI